jgi:hypothetical protein
MRYLVMALMLAAGGCFVGTLNASATPASGQGMLKAAEQASSVTNIAEGCGRGWHRNRWGRCVS